MSCVRTANPTPGARQVCKDPSSGEAVSVNYVEEGEEHYVSVSGSGCGSLFDRVLGRVIYALSEHSDNLMVDRYE